jgi:S-adenosylmethionine-diacylglycerol 3-amino-3-carboxypropyl transferase
MKMNLDDAGAQAQFGRIKYGQGWEDADVLSAALDVQPHHTCLAIAAAGDNVLALLAGAPRAVIAIDMSAAQLACLGLRVAAYRSLDDAELPAFLGARPAADRAGLYRRCRARLSAPDRAFWDARADSIARGIGSAGSFERYLTIFRRHLLPLIHPRTQVAAALRPKSRADREWYFAEIWDTPRWRALFDVFFSQPVMSRLGRDPRFFTHVEADIATHLRARVRHAFVELDPAANPYLHWILTGSCGPVLPFALRPENIARIRQNLDCLRVRHCSLQEFLARPGEPIDRYALSDVFEYVRADTYAELLGAIVRRSTPGARLAYWNMLVPRTRPIHLAEVLVPDLERAAQLHAADKAFFYSRFVIEDVR